MVKKIPGWTQVGIRTFDTKGEAEKFAISNRKEKAKQGMKTRYEINLDPSSGKFRVRIFFYLTDAKGNLI